MEIISMQFRLDEEANTVANTVWPDGNSLNEYIRPEMDGPCSLLVRDKRGMLKDISISNKAANWLLQRWGF